MKILFLSISFIKMIVFFLIIGIGPGMHSTHGSDADYYNEYALGEYGDNPPSIWPIFLRALHEINFYDREVIVILIFFLGAVITPFVFASLLNDNKPHSKRVDKIHNKIYNKVYWCVAAIVAIYPSLIIYSTDIFRDALMVFITGACMYFVKNFIGSTAFAKKALHLSLVLLLSYFAYLFRPYLGFSLFIAFLLFRINFWSIKVSYLVTLYLIILSIANGVGVIEPLLVYRGDEGFESGGSSLGIGLMGKNPVEFILLYLYSALFQFFGLYITSVNAFIFFVTESIFIIFCIIYIIKNRQYSTPFLRYLLLFSVVYGTIWTLGNDNLGTAIRLRMYDYLAITIVAASLYLNKNVNQENMKVHN